ncbi:Pi-transporter A-1 [Histoplasma capsulatum H143]|nr:Pi-transporter A-1 [Histoplasma capsulatum H143]
MPGWLYNMINVCVSLMGYYMAAFFIDNKLYGRKWMQQIGFLMDFIFFVIPAFNFKYYTSPEHIHAFQAMYFLSSFFNQFGPNAVTFLVAAEVFPTPIRATAHGFAAAVGKLGALLAAILYNYIDTQTKFYVVPWFGLAGMVLTWLFLPDTTGLDLKEQERRWYFLRSGRESEYHGPAVHPKHLSLWERIRGAGKYYDPELDYKRKVDEMRGDWEALVARQAAEKELQFEEDDLDEGLKHAHVRSYFERTSPMLFANEKKLGVGVTVLPGNGGEGRPGNPTDDIISPARFSDEMLPPPKADLGSKLSD